MTIKSSGIISLSDINVELGYAANAPISLNDTEVRTLGGKPSGIISLSDFYGKSKKQPIEIVKFVAGSILNAGVTTLTFDNVTIGNLLVAFGASQMLQEPTITTGWNKFISYENNDVNSTYNRICVGVWKIATNTTEIVKFTSSIRFITTTNYSNGIEFKNASGIGNSISVNNTASISASSLLIPSFILNKNDGTSCIIAYTYVKNSNNNTLFSGMNINTITDIGYDLNANSFNGTTVTFFTNVVPIGCAVEILN